MKMKLCCIQCYYSFISKLLNRKSNGKTKCMVVVLCWLRYIWLKLENSVYILGKTHTVFLKLKVFDISWNGKRMQDTISNYCTISHFKPTLCPEKNQYWNQIFHWWWRCSFHHSIVLPVIYLIYIYYYSKIQKKKFNFSFTYKTILR